MKKVVISLIAILVAAAILFGVNVGLDGMTKAREEAVTLQTMRSMLPGSTNFVREEISEEDANILSAYKGETGFVVETKTNGYAGEITMLVAVSNDGKVVGLVVKNLHETLGLGANALTDWQFLARFLNTEGNVAIGTADADAFSSAAGTESSDNETYVDGMTGATVTSKAIARCVNAAVAYVTGADAETGATSWGG